jgi:glucose/arabinose dehydrogenase
MPAGAAELPLQVPAGYVAEQVAGPPLVTHPLMGTFDHKGRLYLAASAGENLPRAELEARLPNYVQRLEDVDGDGRFDKATKFADKLTFPQGCLWWEGSLYVASSGAIWKFTDADDDGIAEQRLKLVGDFGYTGNAADVHGPFAGPDGRIYWCEGRHGHEIKDAAGNIISRGKAARIFNCRPDGSDVQTYCSGGMDNPVEVLFLPNGEMLGTVNLMYSRPRGDCLVNWQYGGVYPREDFAESLDAEFRRTGPLLPEIHNFGHVRCQRHSHAFADGDAVQYEPCGACRPRPDLFGGLVRENRGLCHLG